MKRCLTCNHEYPSTLKECPKCGYTPIFVNDIPAYAPHFAYDGGGGFKASHFAELASLEKENFWFRSRNELILWALEVFSPASKALLEIGCGTGYVLSGIHPRFPSTALFGSEIFIEGLSYAAERVPQATFMQLDARALPYSDEFDVIGAFDVLEHIEDDVTVLTEMHRALKSDGVLLLTIPQHDWLWSASDEYACHARRYSARDIHQKLANAGFSILRSTSFVTLLLPLMMASRFKKKNAISTFNPADELKLPRPLNAVLYKIMQLEVRLIKAGLNFPAGGSRLIIARKKDSK